MTAVSARQLLLGVTNVTMLPGLSRYNWPLMAVLAILWPFWTAVNGFNIDVESAVVFQGSRDSLFGFSVAAHRDQDTGW